VEATCQPVAARNDHDIHWPAMLRDVSSTGIGLVLGRRFEPGAALAIELPETPTRLGATLLARVIHAKPLPGGRWLLGCSLVGELGPDDLERLLGLGEATAAPPPAQAPTLPPARVLASVVFHWQASGTGAKPFQARRLFLTGNWPLAPGTILRVRRGNTPADGAWLRVQVQACTWDKGQWQVTGLVTGWPPTGVLRSLGIPVQPIDSPAG
jgi:hypothetical protein